MSEYNRYWSNGSDSVITNTTTSIIEKEKEEFAIKNQKQYDFIKTLVEVAKALENEVPVYIITPDGTQYRIEKLKEKVEEYEKK